MLIQRVAFGKDIVEIYDDFTDLDVAIAKVSLVDRGVFMSPGWFQFLSCFSSPLHEFFVKIVRPEKMQNILIPLAIYQDRNFHRVLTYYGGAHSDYHGVIGCTNEEFFLNYFQTLLGVVDAISNIQRVDVFLMRSLMSESGLDHCSPSKVKSYKVNIEGTWDEYHSGVKKKIRSDTRRQIKRLNALGQLKFYDNYHVDAEIVVDFMRKNKKAIYGDQLVTNFSFLYDLIRNSNLVKLPAIHVGDKLIALAVCLVNDNKIYYLAPAYDYEYAKYSPGRVLLHYILVDAFRTKCKLVDFGPGDEAYKLDFANQITKLSDLFVGISLKGRIIIFMRMLINKIRDLLNNAFPAA